MDARDNLFASNREFCLILGSISSPTPSPMARIKFFRVVEHLEDDVVRALADAGREVAPNSDVDRRALFRAFSRAVDHEFSLWSRIPDRYVECDDDR